MNPRHQAAYDALCSYDKEVAANFLIATISEAECYSSQYIRNMTMMEVVDSMIPPLSESVNHVWNVKAIRFLRDFIEAQGIEDIYFTGYFALHCDSANSYCWNVMTAFIREGIDDSDQVMECVDEMSKIAIELEFFSQAEYDAEIRPSWIAGNDI